MAFKKNILTLDFDEATESDGDYTFPYNVYNALAVSTGGFACGLGTTYFAPMTVTKGTGTFTVVIGSNSFTCAEATPNVLG